jgi:DNA (cytosine-5)-methyltransferase 1
VALRTISLFSGGAGLDTGLRIACPGARTVCYVESGIENCEVLAARIEEGSLEPAPIWSDVRSFDGKPWRGSVDCIVGGFPCQDISVAGRGEGIVEGNRSGLWFEFARIIREVRPAIVFVENVGALLIRGLDAVLGELAESGYDAEWSVLRASDCGAPHRRERVFILAYAAQRGLGISGESPGRNGFADGGDAAMEYPARHGRQGLDGESGRIGRRGVRETGEPVADAEGHHRGSEQQAGRALGGGRAGSTGDSGPLADSRGRLIPKPWRGPEGRNAAGSASTEPRGAEYPFLGVTQSSGVQGERTGGVEEPPAPTGPWLSGCPEHILPPGPGALDEWRDILSDHPWLAPALSAEEAESYLRGVADGLAALVVHERTDALRMLGNGVVPLQAAAAFIQLARRIGIALI